MRVTAAIAFRATCALCVLLLAGCRPVPSALAAVAATRDTGPPVSGRSAEFQQAQALFQQRDFHAALARLDAILKRPDLSARERAYVQRQREICLAAVGSRQSAVASRPPSAPPPALGNCGPRALAIVAEGMGIKADAVALAKAAGTTKHGTSLDGLTNAAKTIGLEAEGVQVDRNALKQLDTPAIAWVDGDHFLVVRKVAGDEATVHDPNHAKEEVIETEEILRRSGGILLKLTNTRRK